MNLPSGKDGALKRLLRENNSVSIFDLELPKVLTLLIPVLAQQARKCA